MSYPAIFRDNEATFIIDNKPHSIKSTDKNYRTVLEAHQKGDDATVLKLLNKAAGLINYAEGSVEIKDGVVTWNGRELHNALTRRIVKMAQEDAPISALTRFMDNLMQNPSHTAIQELYGFLENNMLPITDDGCFLAYKKVRENYKDIYSGNYDNSVGQIITEERNAVDDNRHNTCSNGLHFCSKEYLPHFGTGPGNRCMILKINPRDVVSIPVDYNNAKGRCCKYEVIGEWDEWHEKHREESVLDDGNAVVKDTTFRDRAIHQDAAGRWRNSEGHFVKAPVNATAGAYQDAAGRWRDAEGRFIKAPK